MTMMMMQKLSIVKLIMILTSLTALEQIVSAGGARRFRGRRGGYRRGYDKDIMSGLAECCDKGCSDRYGDSGKDSPDYYHRRMAYYTSYHVAASQRYRKTKRCTKQCVNSVVSYCDSALECKLGSSSDRKECKRQCHQEHCDSKYDFTKPSQKVPYSWEQCCDHACDDSTTNERAIAMKDGVTSSVCPQTCLDSLANEILKSQDDEKHMCSPECSDPIHYPIRSFRRPIRTPYSSSSPKKRSRKYGRGYGRQLESEEQQQPDLEEVDDEQERDLSYPLVYAQCDRCVREVVCPNYM